MPARHCNALELFSFVLAAFLAMVELLLQLSLLHGTWLSSADYDQPLLFTISTQFGVNFFFKICHTTLAPRLEILSITLLNVEYYKR